MIARGNNPDARLSAALGLTLDTPRYESIDHRSIRARGFLLPVYGETSGPFDSRELKGGICVKVQQSYPCDIIDNFVSTGSPCASPSTAVYVSRMKR